jgi:hypothetical protein
MSDFLEGSFDSREDILEIAAELIKEKIGPGKSLNAFCVENKIGRGKPIIVLRDVCEALKLELKIRVDY